MGEANAKLTLTNFSAQHLMPVVVDAVADTGATLTCIPAGVADQLKLPTLETRRVRLGNGSVESVRYVGPIVVEFEDRKSIGAALVMGDEVLLGCVTMEDMDLVVIPRTRRVAANPEHPDGPVVAVR